MAARMKVAQMGRAARAPVSLSPRDWRLSYPTQTPQVTEGEKPRNHASVKLLVVPVLPPMGWLSAAAAAAVPSRVTARKSCIMERAVGWVMTEEMAGEGCQSGMPSTLETERTRWAWTRMPSLGKTA